MPALAVATAVGDDVRLTTVGCDGGERFRIASITKPLTALLALSELDPDESTGVWPDDVRVRHLLSHTSGFDGEFTERDLSRFGTGDDALARCVAELPSIHRFTGVEEVWSYANTGFWLAAHLAAERRGETYEDALTAGILRPLGLESAGFGEPDLAGSGPEAELGAYPRARRPSGGLAATVHDVLALGRHVASSAAERLRVVHGKPVGGVYGLGLFGERVGGVEVWGHSGSYGGFQSSLLTVPARNAVFAGLTNSGLGAKALRPLEDEFFERVIGARRRVPADHPLPPEVLARFAGAYANADSEVVVHVVDGTLHVRFDDGDYAARPIGPVTFEITQGDHVAERLDFPRPGLARVGSRLAERST